MKILIYGIAFLFCFTAYSQDDVTDKVKGHLSTGNAAGLSSYFTGNVDLLVEDNEDVYSKTQAEMILKNFFAKNMPVSFSIIHKGSSTMNVAYRIGTLKTKNGKEFRVTFNMKDVGGRFLIHQMQIEEN
ncbi:MAG: DUF4783 domain-containing protein [Crocinitomicaceae bacterium]|nr:DUF4783 domain-containing protein [Crocinitomicaceae bacterium]